MSDSCARSLVKLSRLERLHLDTRAIGDASLKDLAPLTTLRQLDLFGAKISDKGCAFLRCNLGNQTWLPCALSEMGA